MAGNINLDRFVRADIRLSAATVSQRGFGTAMLIGYHNAWIGRSRLFSDPADMLLAGMDANHPLYLAALSLCAQTPRPPTFKIGQRLGKPTQKMRLTPAAPTQGDVFAFTIRGVTFSITAAGAPTVAQQTAAIAALIGAQPTAIVASGVSSSLAIQNITGAALNGAVGVGAITPPRNLTITLAGVGDDWEPSTIVVTGLDEVGRVQSENFAVPDLGAVTVVGAKLWSAITNIMIPAQAGAGGTLTAGLGTKFDTGGKLVITATDNTTSVDIIDTNAGDWFGYDNVTENLGIEDRSVDDGAITLTADLTAIKAADADFYAFTVEDAGSLALIELASAWAETQVVEYVAQSSDTIEETADLQGIAYQLTTETRIRTVVAHTRANHRRKLAAGILGVMLPFPAGSAAWAFKQVSGCVPDAYAADVVTRLCGTRENPQSGKRALVYVSPRPTGTNTGTPMTVGGLSAGGQWLEVVAGVDSARADMQAALVNRQLASPKIPFTELGAHAIEGDVQNVLLKYSSHPYDLFDEASIQTSHVPIASVSPSDKQNRYYRGGVSFLARTQGALGAIDISGNILP